MGVIPRLAVVTLDSARKLRILELDRNRVANLTPTTLPQPPVSQPRLQGTPLTLGGGKLWTA